MARRKKRKNRQNPRKEELPKMELAPHLKRSILIIVFLILGILSLLAIFEQAGSLGDIVVRIFTLLFGWAAIIIPILLFAVAGALFLAGRREEEEEEVVSNLRVYLGALFFAIGITGILHLVAMRDAPERAFEIVKLGDGGGYLGVLSAFPLFSLADFWASIAILIGVVIVSFLIMFSINLAAVASSFGRSNDEYDAEEESLADSDVKINQMESAGFNKAPISDEASQNEEVDVDDIEDESVETIEAEKEKVIDFDKLSEKYKKKNWALPSVSLLEDTHNTVDSGNIEANVKIIKKTLADFNIPVEMGEVNVGPTVTQYTLRPAQGIKLSQIVALQNDLALALAASSIRIEAPIPGRSLVGIEVPNKATAIVRLKDIIQTENFAKHPSNLAFALGRDVAGHAMIADLSKMPHLLIAGATGTGKSVCINSLLISLLYRNSPEELRFIVIDPKRVELNLYNGIPQLLTPIVTDHNKAINALKWAVNEMDRRYEVLSEAGKRNIGEYNKSSGDRMPYILIIVDELADLMAVAQADVEAAVVRLAQMARAVGIHLVLATQRPSVDIITGLIKANITARIAFAVASQTDSRTILDMSGAEKLLGSGDMLYITADLGKPKRIQGTYISEKEVKGVVNFLKDQSGDVEYAEEILEKQKVSSVAAGFSDDLDGDDDMLPEAIDEVQRAGKASASFLQRRLRVGYARAARLLDLMEERGIVGPADGAKPRDVYMTSDEGEDNSYDE